jgi:hypothetical protein
VCFFFFKSIYSKKITTISSVILFSLIKLTKSIYILNITFLYWGPYRVIPLKDINCSRTHNCIREENVKYRIHKILVRCFHQKRKNIKFVYSLGLTSVFIPISSFLTHVLEAMLLTTPLEKEPTSTIIKINSIISRMKFTFSLYKYIRVYIINHIHTTYMQLHICIESTIVH